MRLNIHIKFGGVITAIGGFLWLIWPVLIEFVFEQAMVLRRDSIPLELWKRPPIGIPIAFYFFTLENPKQFVRGAKPRVRQVGPYVYK